jgi:hypothetical protein
MDVRIQIAMQVIVGVAFVYTICTVFVGMSGVSILHQHRRRRSAKSQLSGHGVGFTAFDAMLRSFIAMVVVFGSVAWATGCVGRDVPSRVTTETLLAVKPGMTYEELENTVGPPFCYQRSGIRQVGEKTFTNHPVLCFREGATSLPTELRKADLILHYSKDTWNLFFPRVYISTSGGKVGGVYVKESAFYDDAGIYSRNEDWARGGKFYAGGSKERLRELLGR